MSDGAHFLLVKRGLYYRPKSMGYTGIKENAGRYLESEASPRDGVTAIHEDLAPEYSSACFHDVAVQHFTSRMNVLAAALADLVGGKVKP